MLKLTKSSPPRSHIFFPYDGLFIVTEKYFTLLVKGKPVNISVDRLKAAYFLMTDSISDKPTIPRKQSDENSAANVTLTSLSDDKPTVFVLQDKVDG
ncbi:hypothetical protein TNCT_612941 [Trichonephila clavata]|uniref:Uncharacterized protein n=1 Tax=Trichonephila clavata TaxID=2740835 RepID=A0A8X6GT85_TRICU|nr:hypothetical protein TNCT_612941 [Trichonephila clavata]